jgi:hypothetical protein
MRLSGFRRTFLKTHGFSVDIHEPRTGKAGCGLFWTKTEEVYPIHVAAAWISLVSFVSLGQKMKNI